MPATCGGPSPPQTAHEGRDPNCPECGQCQTVYPNNDLLYCLKPVMHTGPHATCLGYHPEPYDEWEWVEWEERLL